MTKFNPPKSTDAQNCKVLEDWTRSPENRDVTKMPTQFLQVETSVISGMQKLLYLSEVKSSEIIVRCPAYVYSPKFPLILTFNSPLLPQSFLHMCEANLSSLSTRPSRVCLKTQSGRWPWKSGTRRKKH